MLASYSLRNTPSHIAEMLWVGGLRSCTTRITRARAATPATPLYKGRLRQEGSYIFGGFGFYTGLLQEAEVPKPVDIAMLPGAKRYAVAVC
jgi:hypothetical protein